MPFYLLKALRNASWGIGLQELFQMAKVEFAYTTE